MTKQGLELALEYLAGIRPDQEQTEAMAAAWALKLARFDDNLILAALGELADRPTDVKAPGGLPKIQVGDVIYACKQIGNRRAIDAATHERAEQRAKELEASTTKDAGHPWDRMTQASRAAYLTQAREHLEKLDLSASIRGKSPMLRSLARFLAGGGDLDAPAHHEPVPFACRGCGRGLVLVDPPTNTADCKGCGYSFVLPADWRDTAVGAPIA